MQLALALPAPPALRAAQPCLLRPTPPLLLDRGNTCSCRPWSGLRRSWHWARPLQHSSSSTCGPLALTQPTTRVERSRWGVGVGVAASASKAAVQRQLRVQQGVQPPQAHPSLSPTPALAHSSRCMPSSAAAPSLALRVRLPGRRAHHCTQPASRCLLGAGKAGAVLQEGAQSGGGGGAAAVAAQPRGGRSPGWSLQPEQRPPNRFWASGTAPCAQALCARTSSWLGAVARQWLTRGAVACRHAGARRARACGLHCWTSLRSGGAGLPAQQRCRLSSTCLASPCAVNCAGRRGGGQPLHFSRRPRFDS